VLEKHKASVPYCVEAEKRLHLRTRHS
jgi:hypothetical protein